MDELLKYLDILRSTSSASRDKLRENFNNFDHAVELIQNSKNICVVAGAGISV
jgi:D-arabinose 5-phosphate isomerase GutQ